MTTAQSAAPDLRTLLTDLGRAGRRLDEMHAVEAGAGNMSIATPVSLGLEDVFPVVSELKLPWTVPALAGRTVLVTGSGCRLRDVLDEPEATVSAVVIEAGGATGRWHTSSARRFDRPTSELNSHLAVHEDQVRTRAVEQQALVHAQPPYLVQLSHVGELRSDRAFNRAILRWEPETIVQLPDGVKVLDFMIPGSRELMQSNVAGLREHRITVWSKHGVMVRSDHSCLDAVDKIEYAETGAMYELRDRQAGGIGEGLADDELRRVVEAFAVPTRLF